MSKLHRRQLVGYGFTYGQVEVIKMQRFYFGRTYREIAKHYKVSTDTIYKLFGKQFEDIKPLRGAQHDPTK